MKGSNFYKPEISEPPNPYPCTNAQAAKLRDFQVPAECRSVVVQAPDFRGALNGTSSGLKYIIKELSLWVLIGWIPSFRGHLWAYMLNACKPILKPG